MTAPPVPGRVRGAPSCAEGPAPSACRGVPTRVTVRLRDGSVRTAEVRKAGGNPADPLSPAEVAAKLARNVGDLVPAPKSCPTRGAECPPWRVDGWSRLPYTATVKRPKRL